MLEETQIESPVAAHREGPAASQISRRTVLFAGAAVAAASQISGASAAADYDPRKSAEGQIKLGATLDGSPAFWLYSGIIYAVQPGMHPRAILAATGCQTSWADRQADGSYLISGATLTYFRDLETGAILETFDNPITGARNEVKSNFLSGASLLYPADGSSARANAMPAKAGAVTPGGYGEAEKQRPLGVMRWSVLGNSVILLTDRSWNVPVQPQLEADSQSCDRTDFFDPSLKRMRARYAGTTIIPWMKWMSMGTTEGHLVWHTSGEKDFSLDGLDPDYRAKAGDLMDRLASKPS